MWVANIGVKFFFMNDNQKKEAEIVRGEFNKKFNGGVVTKISKVSNYKKAEEYHQKYYQKKGVL